MKFRKLVIAAAIVLSAGAVTVPAVVSATPAEAASGFQYCSATTPTACLNAWGGGPFVNIWTGLGGANNDFTADNNPNSNASNIVFTGNGSWAGKCVGDAYNDPNRADTSLDPCATSGNTGGWGTNFTIQPCGLGGFAFKNNHTGGYLAPSNNISNGQPFYLNGPVTCFKVYHI